MVDAYRPTNTGKVRLVGKPSNVRKCRIVQRLVVRWGWGWGCQCREAKVGVGGQLDALGRHDPVPVPVTQPNRDGGADGCGRSGQAKAVCLSIGCEHLHLRRPCRFESSGGACGNVGEMQMAMLLVCDCE